MATHSGPGTVRRWRLYSSRLWILAAALGIATIYSSATLLHGTGRRRTGESITALMTADRVAARARARFEVVAVETFAPISPRTASAQLPRRAALDRLVRSQREAEQCQCRETFPASAFFRYDIAAGTLDVEPVASRRPSGLLPPAVLLRELAADEARRVGVMRVSSMHLLTDSLLGNNAVVTAVQADRHGAGVVVYGLVANAREIGRTLFAQSPALAAFSAPDSDLAQLDTSSVQVVSAGYGTLFGRLDSLRTATATVHAQGALEGLDVSVPLGPGHFGPTVALAVAREQLWLNGFLLLCTALVIGIAASSSRRETLLARARSDFVAGISHDLRMPLAQILLAGETLTLRRDRDETDRLRLVNTIVRETRRLIGLVENVLLFSRAGAVEIRPTLRPLSIKGLFADVVEAVQLAVDEAGQTIEVHPPPSLPVLGDRQLVRQALVNLVDNALKYGARGQRVVLDARQHSPSLVRLRVEDQGPGIPAPDRARVFEPYERLARDQVSERTGTGLGLSVVQHIAEVCRGRVWLEDAEGGGTRAVLELRIADSDDPSDGTPEGA